MKHTWRRLRLPFIGKTVLVLFLLWHMAVIGIWCLPERDPNRVWIKTMREKLSPYIRPYLLVTSQWQNWGVFSQNSLSRIVQHRIDVWKDGRWVPRRDLSFAAIPWFRNEAETSLMRGIEGDDAWPVRERYLQQQCIELRLASGTYLHFAYPYYDMPMPERAKPFSYWHAWKPQWQEWGDTWYTKCHTPPSVDPLPL